MNWERVTYVFYGLLIGSAIGSLAVIYYPNQVNKPLITLNKSVNADTGTTEIQEILFNDTKCKIYKDDISAMFDQSAVAIGGGYSCKYLDSKQKIASLKAALDKAIELEWVK